MALNIQTFKTRALTALLFVAVMLTGLLWNFWSFLVLFSVIHFGCWFEYLKLAEKICNTKIDLVIKWFFAVCGFTLMIVLGLQHHWYEMFFTLFSVEINVKWLFWMLILVCMIVFLNQNKQIPFKAKWLSLAGLLYISLSFALFLNLRDNIFYTNEEFYLLDIGKVYVCGIMFSIWINDTMAYLVGSFFGKTPLSKISPKKTVEGTVGGAVLAVLIIGCTGKLIAFDSFSHSGSDLSIWINNYFWFIIPAICAIFGTLGDLLESKIKRMADVKDSGSFMPGHGGFLDRFDSLLIAVPAVWIFIYFFLR